MEQAIFGQAISEYLRARRLIPWLLVIAFLGGLGFLWHYIRPDADATQQYALVCSMLVYRVVALASAIFTTAIVSQEVEQRTIVYLLTRPVPRWKLILIRYAASVLVVSLIGVLAAIVTSIATFHGFGSNPLLLGDIKALIIGAFAYGALFLFISLIINRSILVCLLFAFGWETSVPNMPGSMGNLSIQSQMQAIAQHPVDPSQSKATDALSGILGANAISPDQAWAVLIGLTLALALLSAWWFTNFEYIPREDAE